MSRRGPSALTSRSRLGGGCLVLFGLPFAAVGVFMGFLASNSILRWNEMRSWREVPAIILEARLEASSGSDSTTYGVKALYEYSFEGQTYRGERVSIHSGKDNIGSFHERTARELQGYRDRAEPFRCFVDPEEPQRSILYRELRLGLLAFYGLFVLLFGGVGSGIMVLAFRGHKKLKAHEKLKEVAPEEPWRWRPEWVGGKIVSGHRKTMIGTWLFAAFWNLISSPLVFLVPKEVLEKKNYPALLGLLFPMIGAGLLVWAIRATLQWRRFGRTVFEMAGIPGVIGGPLRGIIRIPSRFPTPQDGFEITLNSVRRRRRRTGKSRSTEEKVLWQDQRILERPLTGNALSGTVLPVLFAIPFDAQESNFEDPNDKILWRLRVAATLPGVDLDESFEIPIYRTDESSQDFVLEEGRLSEYERPSRLEDVLRRRGAVVRKLPAGGASYFFPSGAPLAQRLVIGSLLLVCSLALGILVRQGAGLLPLFIVGLFEAFLGASAASLWLAQYRVEIREGEVTLQGGLFGPGRPRTFRASGIVSFKITTGAQTGSRVSHDLVLILSGGKQHTLVRAVGSRREAELILEDMKRHLSQTAID